MYKRMQLRRSFHIPILVTMKLLKVVILTLLLCLMEAANIHSKAEEIGIPINNEDDMGMDKGKESYNKASEGENDEAVTSVETQALTKEEINVMLKATICIQ